MDSARSIFYESFPKYGLPVFVIVALILSIMSYFLKGADKDSSLFTVYYVINTLNLILGIVLVGVIIMGQFVNKEYSYFAVGAGTGNGTDINSFAYQTQEI